MVDGHYNFANVRLKKETSFPLKFEERMPYEADTNHSLSFISLLIGSAFQVIPLNIIWILFSTAKPITSFER